MATLRTELARALVPRRNLVAARRLLTPAAATVAQRPERLSQPVHQPEPADQPADAVVMAEDARALRTTLEQAAAARGATPHQLAAASCVLLRAASPAPRMLLGAASLRRAVSGRGAGEFSARGFAELAWAISQVSRRRPLDQDAAQHLRGVVQQEEMDWRAWLAGAPPATVVTLLFSLASLGWQPCAQLVEAASACLPAPQLARMSSQSLVWLVWALGALRRALHGGHCTELMQAVSQELAGRMEQELAVGAAVPRKGASSNSGTDATTLEEPASLAEGEPGTVPDGSSAGDSAPEHVTACRRRRGREHLTTAHLGLLLEGYGRLRHHDDRLLHAASHLLHSRVGELHPTDTARVLQGLAQLGFCPPRLLADVAYRLEQPGALEPFSGPQLAAALSGFAGLDYFPGQRCVDLLADACAARRGALAPRQMSRALHALARLGLVDEPFYQEWVPTILRQVSAFSIPELANVARVYSQQSAGPGASEPVHQLFRAIAGQTLGLEEPALLEAVDEWANARLAALSPQVCWSFASLGFHPGPVLVAAAGALATRTREFTDKDASNVLWALATLRERPAPAALDAVATALQGRLRGFGAQALANIAWAFATFGQAPPQAFLEVLGAAAATSVRAFEPQGLSLTAWALGSLGAGHPGFLQGVVQDCLQRGRLHEFEAQHLSNLLWGMSASGFHPGPEFLRALALEAELRLCDFKPQELFNILHSYSRLRFRPQALPAAAAAEAAARAVSFSPQELAGSLWALARLGCPRAAAPLLAAAEHELVARPAEFADRHVALLAWAWGRLGHAPGPEAAAALVRAAQERAPALGAQALTTLVAGLAQLQLPQAAARRLQRGPEGGALLARTLELLPELKPFEYAQLARGLAALGVEPAAEWLLGPGASPKAKRALDAAAAGGPITAAVQLLWAMARWRTWPDPTFAVIASRLKKTSPRYAFSPANLVLLGQALQLAGTPQAAKLRQMRTALRRRAAGAAAAAVNGWPLGQEGVEEEEADLTQALHAHDYLLTQ
eukprot:scaffold1.g5477.t1